MWLKPRVERAAKQVWEVQLNGVKMGELLAQKDGASTGVVCACVRVGVQLNGVEEGRTLSHKGGASTRVAAFVSISLEYLGLPRVRVHSELEAEGMDMLAEPDHAMRVTVSVDGQCSIRPAEAGGVAAVEVDVGVPSSL